MHKNMIVLALAQNSRGNWKLTVHLLALEGMFIITYTCFLFRFVWQTRREMNTQVTVTMADLTYGISQNRSSLGAIFNLFMVKEIGAEMFHSIL